jgi:hypothetical protein
MLCIKMLFVILFIVMFLLVILTGLASTFLNSISLAVGAMILEAFRELIINLREILTACLIKSDS